MHVCFLIHREYPQNNATAPNEYTRILAKKGIEVTVIAGRSSEKTPKHEVISGVDVHRIDTDKTTSASIEPTRFALRGFRLLNQLCSNRDIDVLHMFGFPNLGLVLRPPQWFEKPPAVITDIRGAAASTQFRNVISRVVLRLQHYISQTTITIDPLMAEHLFGTNEIDILPLGADFDKFKPGSHGDIRKSMGFDEDDVVFGYVGSVSKSRRLGCLVNAALKTNQKHPRAKFVIIGGGDNLNWLRTQIKKSNANESIVLLGEKPFPQMPRFLRSFDVGLSYIPNLRPYRIQPPIKTVEYLATGLPVLGTKTPGNQRFIENRRNGLYFSNSEAEISKKMIQLIESPNLRKQLGSTARESVRQYDYDHIVENKLIPIYKKVLHAVSS